MPPSRSLEPHDRPSIPPGSSKHRGRRMPSLPARRLSLHVRARAVLCAAITTLGTTLLRGCIALHPLLGERQNLSRARRGIPPSAVEIGEGSAGQPTPTHPCPPVPSTSSPRIPTPISRSATTPGYEPYSPLQDHQTRRHGGHIRPETGHIPPKSGHISPKTGHIRQKSGHIGLDGGDTCLADRSVSPRRSRVRR